MGNPKKNKLIVFVQRNNHNTLTTYQLNKAYSHFSLSDRKKNILAKFISKVKTKFRMHKTEAPGESASVFKDRINVYNASRSIAEEKFDIYNLK